MPVVRAHKISVLAKPVFRRNQQSRGSALRISRFLAVCGQRGEDEIGELIFYALRVFPLTLVWIFVF
jgi:hypothetical protein